MEIDKYNHWAPDANLPTQFYLNGLNQDGTCLKIKLKDTNDSDEKELSLTFENYLSFRVTQESGRLKTLDNSSLGTFGMTTASEYIRWFRDEGLGIYDTWELVHYIIVNLDNVVDVITLKAPSAEWV